MRHMNRISAGIVFLALLLPVFFAVDASAAESAWKVGRGVIQKGASAQDGLILKLSLRNDGLPSRATVEVLGRWTDGGQERPLRLGLLTQEVELKKTAIIEFLLRPLGPAPPGNSAVELTVMTGDKVTDRRVVAIER